MRLVLNYFDEVTKCTDVTLQYQISVILVLSYSKGVPLTQFVTIQLFFFQIKMKVGIVQPRNETCRFLASRLLEQGHQVAFLCPNEFDVDIASNMIFELSFLGLEQDSLHHRKYSFTVVKQDLSDCHVVGVFE